MRPNGKLGLFPALPILNPEWTHVIWPNRPNTFTEPWGTSTRCRSELGDSRAPLSEVNNRGSQPGGQGSLLGEEGPAANAVQSPGAGIWKCGSPITSIPDSFRIPLSKTDSERTALPKCNRLAPAYLPTFARALRTKPDDKRGNLPKTAATAGDRCGLQKNGSKCLDLDSFG